MKKRELDNMLDQVTAGIRGEQIEDAQVSDAANRTWAQMSANDAIGMNAKPDAVASSAAAIPFQRDPL